MELKADRSCGAVKCTQIPSGSEIVREQITPNTAPFLARSYSFCSQILTDKSSKCQCKTGDRKESKSLDLHIRTTSGNRHFPKLVDICLDEYICQRNDRVLESCGQTIRNDLAEHIGIQIDPVQMKPKLLRTVKHRTIQRIALKNCEMTVAKRQHLLQIQDLRSVQGQE